MFMSETPPADLLPVVTMSCTSFESVGRNSQDSLRAFEDAWVLECFPVRFNWCLHRVGRRVEDQRYFPTYGFNFGLKGERSSRI